MRFPVVLVVSLIVALAPGPLLRAEDPKPDAAAESKKDGEKPKEEPEKKTDTRHSVSVGGHKVKYQARAGVLPLKDRENKTTAEIFYIAYTKEGVDDLAKRPVTFSFNGGPGSSSVWLHLGLLGPRRVVLEEDGSPVSPPYRLVDNEYSLLDETDLVFIDPVSTGYSRASKPDDARQFHGLEGDVRSVAEFIRLYATRNTRWASPKFLIGESYGTTRAAALSRELRDRHWMNVNGILLVSTVLNFQTIRFDEGNDLPYVLFLPSYTAAAWYHKKLPPDLQSKPLSEVLAEAETFASGDYQAALFQGAGLAGDARLRVVRQVARWTGLSEELVDRVNLRVTMSRFAAELLRAENRVIGRFDSRYKGLVLDRLSPGMPYDPSGEAIMSAYASTFNHYVRTELKYETDLTYEILTGSVQPWSWGNENSYVNVATALADSLTRNPFLKVHVSNGYFDLATPYFGAIHTFRQMKLDAELAKNVTIDHYTAGHMMYVNLPDLKKQKADLSKFLRGASGLAER
jgi:carboxypeptidase C (cathepsin A)